MRGPLARIQSVNVVPMACQHLSLCLVGVLLFGAAAQTAASQTPGSLLMPNETLCGQDYYTSGVVIEASHFVSAQKYFSCDIKFKTNAVVHADFRWVLRIERVFIPYITVDPLVIVPPAVHIHTSNETYTIQYQKDFSIYAGAVIRTQRLVLQFANLPQDSNYKLVITLDTGDQNCTSGFMCRHNHYCIDSSLLCDGEDHCGDGTDEIADVCPDPTDVIAIVIIAGGSILLATLVGLAVMLVIRCRHKRSAHYNEVRHQRQVAAISKRATVIREPRRNPSTGSADTTSMRRSGLGYQPAPLVLTNSVRQADVHSPRRSSEGTTSYNSTQPESLSPSSTRELVESVSSDCSVLLV